MLQGARASTITESTARAALFIGALSSALIALGFISQVQAGRIVFGICVLVVLPTLYLLGWFTVVRLVASSIEDIGYGRAINRIRFYYLEIAGDRAHYFALSAHDDTHGVLANMTISRPSRWQLYFTLDTMITLLTAVVGGSFLAFPAYLLSAALGAAVAIGAAFGLLSAAASIRWQRRTHEIARQDGDVINPSPTTPRS